MQAGSSMKMGHSIASTHSVGHLVRAVACMLSRAPAARRSSPNASFFTRTAPFLRREALPKHRSILAAQHAGADTLNTNRCCSAPWPMRFGPLLDGTRLAGKSQNRRKSGGSRVKAAQGERRGSRVQAARLVAGDDSGVGAGVGDDGRAGRALCFTFTVAFIVLVDGAFVVLFAVTAAAVRQ